MSKTRSQFKYPTTPENGIPAFNCVEEQAEYWDTHDTTDLSELRPVDLSIDSEFSQELAAPLASGALDQLVRLVRTSGVSPTAPAQMWVEEQLRQEIAAQQDLRGTDGRRSLGRWPTAE